MKKQVQLGLVVEGKSGTSTVLHLPTVPEDLGPVKSASFRVARRLSNMLHAGYAVAEYEELQAARLILLRVPDGAVCRIVEELCATEFVFRNLTFVLCESWLAADVLEPLRARGSAVATLIGLPSAQDGWFVVEGQTSAVRQVRRFLERNEMRALEIRAEGKPLLFAAELLTTVLPLPLFNTAQQALRTCGISGNHLSRVLDLMARKMFQNFLNGSRLIWGGPLTECSQETSTAYLQSLERNHPQIAEVLKEQFEWAHRKMPKAKSRIGAD